MTNMAAHEGFQPNLVLNTLNNPSVSVIAPGDDKKLIPDIPVDAKGLASDMALDSKNGKLYLTNEDNNTVSVINTNTDKRELPDIPVGESPTNIVYNPNTGMIYIANGFHAHGFAHTRGTVSVIDSLTDKIAAGVLFNVNPSNSGKIICNNTAAPTNTYLYIDTGMNCMAEPNKDFEFNTWDWSPLTNRNSSTPLQSNSSGNLTVNRYGVFTVNFRQPHPLQELFTYLTTALETAVAINGAILTVPGFIRTRKQSKTLSTYLYKINDKYSEFSDKSKAVNKSEYLTFFNILRKDIISLVQKRAINESQYQILDEKITEYINRINDEK